MAELIPQSNDDLKAAVAALPAHARARLLVALRESIPITTLGRPGRAGELPTSLKVSTLGYGAMGLSHTSHRKP